MGGERSGLRMAAPRERRGLLMLGNGLSAQTVASTYLQTLDELLRRVNLDQVERVVDMLCAVRDAGGGVFVAGNGGSAATASHWVNDLGKATKTSGRPSMRIMGLSDNTPWLTALANDEGYDRVFAGQLENFARPGDLLVVISASGRSPNLVQAVEYARQQRVTTVGVLGFDGGVLKDMVDEAVVVESETGAYGLVESAHCVVLDILTTCLINDWAPGVTA